MFFKERGDLASIGLSTVSRSGDFRECLKATEFCSRSLPGGQGNGNNCRYRQCPHGDHHAKSQARNHSAPIR